MSDEEYMRATRNTRLRLLFGLLGMTIAAFVSYFLARFAGGV